MQPILPRHHRDGALDRALNIGSGITLIMTVPQVLVIWMHHSAGSVSLLSWAAYLVAACLWLAHGIERRDPSIYIPCIGWIALDAAVVLGTIVYR